MVPCWRPGKPTKAGNKTNRGWFDSMIDYRYLASDEEVYSFEGQEALPLYYGIIRSASLYCIIESEGI